MSHMLTSQATGTSEKSQSLFNQTIQIPVFKHTGIWPSLGGVVQTCHMDSVKMPVSCGKIFIHIKPSLLQFPNIKLNKGSKAGH